MLVEAEHFVDAGATAGERPQRPRAHGIDANPGRPEVVGHVLHTRIEGRLADAHDVVAGDDLLAAEVGEGQNGAVGGEDPAGEAADGKEAVGAGLHRHPEALTAAVGRLSLEILHRGVGDRVDEEVDRAELLLGPLHNRGDLFVAAGIHRHEELRVWLRVGEHRDTAPVPLPLVVGAVGEVGEADLPPLGEDLLGNRPSDRVVVGDTEDDTFKSVEPTHRIHPPDAGTGA